MAYKQYRTNPHDAFMGVIIDPGERNPVTGVTTRYPVNVNFNSCQYGTDDVEIQKKLEATGAFKAKRIWVEESPEQIPVPASTIKSTLGIETPPEPMPVVEPKKVGRPHVSRR